MEGADPVGHSYHTAGIAKHRRAVWPALGAGGIPVGAACIGVTGKTPGLGNH
jgi:hypothetical protein